MQKVTINPMVLALLQSKSEKNDIKTETGSFRPKSNKAKVRHDSKRGKSGAANAIKDDADIKKAEDFFLNQPQRYWNSKLNVRNYLLFIIGLNCGRRISDIIKFKFGDFLNKYHQFKDYVEIKEQKTGKIAKFYINQAIRNAIGLYLDSIGEYDLNDYIFPSRSKQYNGVECSGHISIRRANEIYNQMGEEIGLAQKGYRISTHTARKTAAYKMIEQSPNDIRTLISVQKFLNHSSFAQTLAYADIQQEEIDSIVKNLNLWFLW